MSTSKHQSILLTALLWLSGHTLASGSGDIAQQLDRLNVLGSVLYIAAHPDDENTQLLTWLDQHRHLRTGYLSLTRGDGGQNLIGSERGASLGIIRTHELLAARKIDGAEQFFTRAVDFGFSKTSKETLSLWDREKILADVVWIIRNFQPDVIITRFPVDARAGHGHHQASSILAQEAFRAAADPTRFPEQLSWVPPWQAKRIVWNTWLRFLDSGDTTSDDQLKKQIGGLNVLTGKHYGEISAKSRDQHKSQGFGSAVNRGIRREHFAHLDGTQAKADLFEDIHTGWSRIAGSSGIDKKIRQLQKAFDPHHPEKLVKPLSQLLAQLRQLPDSPWVSYKRTQVENLLLQVAGVHLESLAEAKEYAAGDTLHVVTEVLSETGIPVAVRVPGNSNQDQQLPTAQLLQPGEITHINTTLALTHTDQPYWLEKIDSEYTWQVDDQQLIGLPVNNNRAQVDIELTIAGQTIAISREVQHKYVDPIRGEVYQPIQVAPRVTATLDAPVYLFSQNNQQDINVQLYSFAADTRGQVRPIIPDGWQVKPTTQPFHFEKSGEQQVLRFKLTAPTSASSGDLRIALETAGQQLNKGLTRIAYEHIPVTNWYPESRARLEKLDVKISKVRIGYFPGPGDEIPAVLQQLGYHIDILNSAELIASAEPLKLLQQYGSLITGGRAINVDADLRQLLPVLHQYIEQGGTLVSQYNTLANLPTGGIGPYPFSISRDRITDERAAVTFLQADHPLLNYPNKITAADFNGWVQERGLYFARDYEAHYTVLLAFSDDGEQPLQSGLLTANYGKGRFVYAPLSFFRQLPAGVSGATRLFANVIAPLPQ